MVYSFHYKLKKIVIRIVDGSEMYQTVQKGIIQDWNYTMQEQALRSMQKTEPYVLRIVQKQAVGT